MNIIEYNVKEAFTILDILFVKSDTIYITSNSYRNSGSRTDWKKVFDGDKKHLGSITTDTFNKIRTSISHK